MAQPIGNKNVGVDWAEEEADVTTSTYVQVLPWRGVFREIKPAESARRDLLTSCLTKPPGPRRAICPNCAGKGRCGATGGRGKCNRCRGKGYTEVGKKRR